MGPGETLPEHDYWKEYAWHTLDPREKSRRSIVAGWHLRMELLEEALRGTPADWAALDASRDERGIVARIAEIYVHYKNRES